MVAHVRRVGRPDPPGVRDRNKFRPVSLPALRSRRGVALFTRRELIGETCLTCEDTVYPRRDTGRGDTQSRTRDRHSGGHGHAADRRRRQSGASSASPNRGGPRISHDARSGSSGRRPSTGQRRGDALVPGRKHRWGFGQSRKGETDNDGAPDSGAPPIPPISTRCGHRRRALSSTHAIFDSASHVRAHRGSHTPPSTASNRSNASKSPTVATGEASTAARQSSRECWTPSTRTRSTNSTATAPDRAARRSS